MKFKFLVGALTLFAAHGLQAQNKTFTEKLDGIKTNSKELTKNAQTDNSSIGQGGAMNTSVPLVEVKSRTMSFPLELQYSSGIQVNQESGDVGLGWSLPLGRIVRDYGAFEPDYTSLSGELGMNGQFSWLNPCTLCTSVNPNAHNQALQYDGVKNNGFGLNDEYHVSVPGALSNTFWNQASIDQPQNWVFSDFEKYKVSYETKIFEIAQEFSRINELNLISSTSIIDNKELFDKANSKIASAIGVLPYVINGKARITTGNSPTVLESTVSYEDYNKFIITDNKGYRYVFGRPLRGQKYVFNDDPYWTTNPIPNVVNSGNGNFWKIDFIAEWLLTEILSPDYADINANGIADDADNGDWIRFEYTQPTKVEETTFIGLTHNKLEQEVPTHRTWSNFSQTDRASSLMREMAYLTKIVTPLQEIDLAISQRFEVDHDYYSKPANKVGDNHFFEDRQYTSTETGGASSDFDILYPVETMKYDRVDIKSRLFDKELYPNADNKQGSIVLNYAAKGSEQELAVSNFLIRDNANVDRLIDKPSTNSFHIEEYFTGVGRGKTTLLGVSFYDNKFDETTKTSYEFEYGFNPKYDEIHKREIARKYFFPSLRQAQHPSGLTPDRKHEVLIDYEELTLSSNGLGVGVSEHVLYPFEFLIDFPYQEGYQKYNELTPSQIEFFVEDSDPLPADFNYEPISHTLQPIMDVYGYFYAENCDKCPEAWSLSKITYPTGGIVSFEYEPGEFEKDEDNPNWSIKENGIPMIKDYNDLAEERSAKQDVYNRYVHDINPGAPVKLLTASFRVDLPEKYGIRLKRKTIDDRLNIPVVTNYQYQEGHFTALPSEYLSNYISGFNSFIMHEKFRHEAELGKYAPDFDVDANLEVEFWTTDYDIKMQYSVYTGLELDDYTSTHFYERIDEKEPDGSFTRNHYGKSSSIMGLYPDYNVYASRLPDSGAEGRFILGGSSFLSDNIALTKTEYFEADATQAYKSEEYIYTDLIDENISKSLEFQYATTPAQNKVVLWDNTYEYYLPLTAGLTSLYYLSQGIDVGPMSATTHDYGGDFGFHEHGNNEEQHYIRSKAELLLTPSSSYPKWTTGKRLLSQKITTYKGMITINEYTYDGTDFNIRREAVSSNTNSEKLITAYEYAHENYSGISTKFTDLNLRSSRTKVTTYLNSISNSNVLSATVMVYDVGLAVPKLKNTYVYESAINPSSGVFTLVPYSFTALSNPNWKISENENHDFNHNGNLISFRTNRLYSKEVIGYDENLTKASFRSPNGFFDATYTGFEDIHGRNYIGDWTADSYKDETWYGQTRLETEFEAKSSFFKYANKCGYNFPYTGITMSRYLNVISMDDVSGLAVGDLVEVRLTPGENASTEGLVNYNYTTTRVISAILDKSVEFSPSYLGEPTYENANQYILCFAEPVEFPKSTEVYGAPGLQIGEPEVDCGNIQANHCYTDESAEATIAETKVVKIEIEFNLSNQARTGLYSYRLPTIRTDEPAKKTPVRPVKLEATSNLEAACQGNGPYPAACYTNYEASVWLNMKNDIAESQTANSGLTNYLRGTISSTVNQGVKIICKVWNADRTAVLETRTFYPQSLEANWKKYTVHFPLLKSVTDKWVEVYVENNISQINAPISQRKSLYVDDILVYPQDAKYNYSICDQFGNPTFQADNNDVFVEMVYDDKGRQIVQKNAFGRIISENSYFEQADWTHSNNHVTTRSWVQNGLFNETRAYMDGFGKTKQSIASDRNRNVRIVTQTLNYDSRGRVKRAYNPYYLQGFQLANKYDPNAQSNTHDIYNSDFAYSEVQFENIPEEKVQAFKLPHYAGQLDEFSSQRDYASESDVTQPYSSAVYLAGTLLVHELTDEMGNISKTYMDYRGRVILEEREIGFDYSQNPDGSILVSDQNFQIAQTWFEYDAAGRLIRVYDPEGKKTEYFYNSLSQLIRSHTPDKGESDMRYNRFGQLRFIRDSKDIDATAHSPYHTDQFNYTKYDAWGRVSENGIVQAMMTTVPGTPPFVQTNVGLFNNTGAINDADFPNAVSYLTEVHARFEYDGSRDQYDSDQLLREYTYSDHVLLNSVYRFTPGRTDQKSYSYHADQLPKKVEYIYNGLSGTHTIEYTYNSHRLPVGKRYIHPNTPGFNFAWLDEIDNMGRVTLSKTIHNNTTRQINKNYYDPMGNLFMNGLGTTGLSADPHQDYVYYRKNVKGQLVNQQSEQFRFALTYDKTGNITRNVWSNERFDPTFNPLSVHLNVYEYSYDRMKRLIGADYKEATLTENPFASFNTLKSNIPPDFECTWLITEHGGGKPIKEELGHLQQNVEDHVREHESRKAINSLNIIEREYDKLETAFHEKPLSEQNQFLQQLIVENKKAKEDVLAYEYVKSVELNDQAQLAIIEKEKNPKPEQLKYTKELIIKHSKLGKKVCVPNDHATIFGILPAFNSNQNFTNSYPYDAAYWYSNNGNLEQLNRNDHTGEKTRQNYYYQNPLNNQLSQVEWTVGLQTPFNHSYEYDRMGNLTKDLRNNVSDIAYSPYFELPLAITNPAGTKKYRYDNNRNRSVKEISSTDFEFYIDAVILDQNGQVKSYQTQNGYAVPAGNNLVKHFYNIKDHLGTNRIVLEENGILANAADHYPYGKRMPNRFYVSDNEGNRRQFTGHEFDGETGYEYHGARYYNEELARYMNVDPMASQAHEWTPYRYAFDNPNMFIDPNGMYETWGDAWKAKRAARKAGYNVGRIYGEKGNYVFNANTENSHSTFKYANANSFTPAKSNNGIMASFFQEPLNATPTDRNGKYHDGHGMHYTDKSNIHYNNWMKTRTKVNTLQKGLLIQAGASLVAPFIISYAITTAPIWMPAIGNGTIWAGRAAWTGAKAYHNTFGMNGGYLNLGANYVTQSISTGSMNPMDHNMFEYGASAFAPKFSVETQCYIGAGGGLINYTPNKEFKYFGNQDPGITLLNVVNGGTSPIYNLAGPLGVFMGNAQQAAAGRAINNLEDQLNK